MNNQDTPINIIASQLDELVKHTESTEDYYQEVLPKLVWAAINYSEATREEEPLTEQSKTIFARLKKQFNWMEENEQIFEQSALIDEFIISEGNLLLDAIDDAQYEDETRLIGKMVRPYTNLIRSYNHWRDGEDFIANFRESYKVKYELVSAHDASKHIAAAGEQLDNFAKALAEQNEKSA